MLYLEACKSRHVTWNNMGFARAAYRLVRAVEGRKMRTHTYLLLIPNHLNAFKGILSTVL